MLVVDGTNIGVASRLSDRSAAVHALLTRVQEAVAQVAAPVTVLIGTSVHGDPYRMKGGATSAGSGPEASRCEADSSVWSLLGPASLPSTGGAAVASGGRPVVPRPERSVVVGSGGPCEAFAKALRLRVVSAMEAFGTSASWEPRVV